MSLLAGIGIGIILFLLYRILVTFTDVFGCNHTLDIIEHIESPFTDYELKLGGGSASHIRSIDRCVCTKCGIALTKESVR
jgi:hypothetical protein